MKEGNNKPTNFGRGHMAGNVVFMPDIEYKSWVNRNKDLLDDITKTGKVSTLWLAKGNNKSFLVRYFKECGYTITID